MINAVTRISAIEPSVSAQIHTSMSIDSESEKAWVAARQSHITSDLLERRMPENVEDKDDSQVDPDSASNNGRPIQSRGIGDAASEDLEGGVFSGESDRIGTTNFDEKSKFGHRVAIV